MITVCENETTPASAPTLNRGLTHLSDSAGRGLAVKATRVCSVDLCDRPHFGRGWCHAHYMRWRRHGAVGAGAIARPLTVGVRGAEHPRWRGADARLTYGGAHDRVISARGRAADHPCAEQCGAQAREWAYDHGDPDEQMGDPIGDGRYMAPYSVNPVHYRPLCKPCHQRFDIGKARARR